jgi:hypothetical protein
MHSDYRYQGFGLVFESNIGLPTFRVAEGAADVVIRVVRGLPAPPPPPKDAPFPWMRGKFPPGLVFETRPDRIKVWVREDVEDDLIRTYLSGYIIGVCLRQRGMLVLHAACVARGDKAIAFVGQSGWGKSTLAAHFVAQGFDLLGDDLTAIVIPKGESPDEPTVYPGLAHIRLYADTGAALMSDFESLPRLHSYSQKRVGYAPPESDRPRPLVKIYALEGAFGPSVAVEQLAPGEAFVHLAAHTRALHEFGPEMLRRHLDQCTRLLRLVPMARLHRRRSLEALDEVVSAVEEDACLVGHSEVSSHRDL